MLGMKWFQDFSQQTDLFVGVNDADVDIAGCLVAAMQDGGKSAHQDKLDRAMNE